MILITKKKKILNIFKSKKNKLCPSISDQNLSHIFSPTLKLVSLSLESLYVPINDLVEKDSETVVETLNLTPRERHRGILEQMEEV